MVLILEAIEERALRDTVRPEDREQLKKLVARESAALLNQRCTIGGVEFDAVQGEFSGIRLTDCFNSISNYAMYLMVRQMWMEALQVDLEAVVIKRTHIGDDMSMIAKHAAAPAMVAYGLAAMGCVLNGVKQYLSVQQIEFLRRLVSAGGIYAFKNRAVGNLSAPPVQREVEDFVSLKGSQCLAAGEIFRRGGSMAGTTNRMAYILGKLELGYTGSGNMDLQGVHVQKERATASCANHGLGLYEGYESACDMYELYFRKLPRVGSHMLHRFQKVPRFATSDLVREMSRRQRYLLEEIGVKVDRLADDMHKLLLQSSIPAGSKQRQLDKELRANLDAFTDQPLMRSAAQEPPAKRVKLNELTLGGTEDLHRTLVPTMKWRDWQMLAQRDGQWFTPALIEEDLAKTAAMLKSLELSNASRKYDKHMAFVERLCMNMTRCLNGVVEEDTIGVYLVKLLGKAMNRGSLVNQYSVTRAMGETHVQGMCAMLLLQEDEFASLLFAMLGSDMIKLVAIIGELQFDKHLSFIIGDSLQNMIYTRLLGRLAIDYGNYKALGEDEAGARVFREANERLLAVHYRLVLTPGARVYQFP
jgi:hypothetical protein